MLRIATSALVIALAANSAAALDCSTEQEIRKAEIREEFIQVKGELRKATARADAQDLRLVALPESVQESVPSRPETPRLPTKHFDGDSIPVIACDKGFDTMANAIVASLSTTRQEITAFAQTIANREESLTVAEASVDPVDDSENSDTVNASGAGGAGTDASDSGESGVTTTEARREPLRTDQHPTLFRRVVSLPGSRLLSEAGTDLGDGEPLPTFSVLYVFEESTVNGVEYLEVGPSTRQGSQGWVKKDDTLDWSTMLVMQFAPRGQRKDVLFFEDSTELADIVRAPTYRAEAEEIYDRLETERSLLRGDPAYIPKWGGSLVAIEPKTGVTFRNDPYILPILDSREEEFDGSTETVLLKVAAVPARETDIADRDDSSFYSDPGARAAEDGEFRIGVVFVLDTTISMAPFIERAYETVQGFYDAFNRFESSAFVSYGLVAFRDNIDVDPDELEYVTKIFQPLDTEAEPGQVLTNMRQIKEATAPTVDFQEDGFAGLLAAIEQMDWSPFDSRLIIFVSDASSREGPDPLSKISDVNSAVVAEMARNRNVAIVPIHLRTPSNQRQDDVSVAESQYRALSETGDVSYNKYFQLDAESSGDFGTTLELLSNEIVQGVLKANAGQLIQVVEMEPVVQSEENIPQQVAQAVANEIFRAQLESLATVGNGDAPSFLAGWAADRDLTNPDVRALEVSVFLTRNQLSTLDKRLSLIVDAFRKGGDNPKAFFEKLQILAAETSTDPDAPPIDDRNAIRTLLPSFLAALPYRSQALKIDQSYWASISVAQRQEFIEAIDAKRRIYDKTFSQTDLWRDFGSGDPGLEATPIRLVNLP